MSREQSDSFCRFLEATKIRKQHLIKKAKLLPESALCRVTLSHKFSFLSIHNFTNGFEIWLCDSPRSPSRLDYFIKATNMYMAQHIPSLVIPSFLRHKRVSHVQVQLSISSARTSSRGQRSAGHWTSASCASSCRLCPDCDVFVINLLTLKEYIIKHKHIAQSFLVAFLSCQRIFGSMWNMYREGSLPLSILNTIII